MIKEKGHTLKLLIEASGHINFDKNMLTDHKGLYSIEGIEKNAHWTMWKFPIVYEDFNNWKLGAHEEEDKWGKTSPKVYPG